MKQSADEANEHSENDLIGTYDAARLLKVAPTTVQRWIDDGAFPCFRTVGNHRRIRKTDLVEFLKKQNIQLPTELHEAAPKVLVVDDDVYVQKVLPKLLREKFAGAEVDAARDGVEALLKIGNWVPDLIVLDVVMPNMNGVEVVKHMKSEAKYKHIKIVAYSGSDVEHKEDILTAGADAFFLKGASHKEFLEALPKFLPALKTKTAKSIKGENP